MKAITKFLAAGAVIAAAAGAAPAAAQMYPGNGYGNAYGNGYNNPYGSPYGNAYNSPYGSPYGNGMNSQAVVGQCANAVQARLNGGYNGYSGYGYNGYGNNGGGYGGGRVLGISRVEPSRDGGFNVRGVATNGYSAYGSAPNAPNLVWRCRTDFRGVIVDIDVNAAQSSHGYNYTPWNHDYSQYGYQRY
ncbi:MAG TPA: hypothetical protein VGM04_03570 [Sphingomicrobium sp.]|jgi:hypothetical protein